jgi:hypothetical protein
VSSTTDEVDAVCDALQAQGAPLLDPPAREAIRAGLAQAPELSDGQVLAVARLLRGSRNWPTRTVTP